MAAVDANCQGRDGNATIREKIQMTAPAKENEEERARGGRVTLAPLRWWRSQQQKEGGRGGITDHHHHRRRRTRTRKRRRRKVNEGAQAAATKMTATVEEDEAKMIDVIDVGGTNDSADDPDVNKDGSDNDGDGSTMLANGTEVSRHDIDVTSKQGYVCWTLLHHFIVDFLN